MGIFPEDGLNEQKSPSYIKYTMLLLKNHVIKLLHSQYYEKVGSPMSERGR